MPKLPKKKKYPKGLKRRANFKLKKQARLAENKRIEADIKRLQKLAAK